MIRPLTEISHATGLSSSLLGRHQFASIGSMRNRSRICLALAAPVLGLTPNPAQTPPALTCGSCDGSNRKLTLPSAETIPAAQLSSFPRSRGEGRLRQIAAASLRHSSAYSALRCLAQKASVSPTTASNTACMGLGTDSEFFGCLAMGAFLFANESILSQGSLGRRAPVDFPETRSEKHPGPFRPQRLPQQDLNFLPLPHGQGSFRFARGLSGTTPVSFLRDGSWPGNS